MEGGGAIVICPRCGQTAPANRRPLTKAQRQLYDTFVDLSDRNRVAPTFQELADELGYNSVGTIADHIKTLVGKGWFVRDGKFSTARAYRAVEE